MPNPAAGENVLEFSPPLQHGVFFDRGPLFLTGGQKWPPVNAPGQKMAPGQWPPVKKDWTFQGVEQYRLS